jgi:hypothetical protein
VNTHKVPVYSQANLALCWEACARMMWHFKKGNLNDYRSVAGGYANITVGITELQLDTFYKKLGLRSFPSPQGKNVRHALTFSPVVVVLRSLGPSHAVVAIGHANGQYEIINPAAKAMIDFETNAESATGGKVVLREAVVDAQLGKYIWYW